MRKIILPWLVWAVIFGLAVGAALYPACSRAAEVFRGLDDIGGPAVLTLYEKPCTNELVLAHLHDKLLDYRRFKESVLKWHGREWASCWAERHGVVHSMDEAGSPFQPVPRRLFRDESV